MDANSSNYRDGTPVYVDGKAVAFWCEGCTPDNCCGCPAREKPEPELPFDLQYALDKATTELHKAEEALREASSAADRWRLAYWEKKYGVKKGDKVLATQAMVDLGWFGWEYVSLGQVLEITHLALDGSYFECRPGGVISARYLGWARQAWLDRYGEGEK